MPISAVLTLILLLGCTGELTVAPLPDEEPIALDAGWMPDAASPDVGLNDEYEVRVHGATAVVTARPTIVEPPAPRPGSLTWHVDAETEELVDYESSRYNSGIVHCTRSLTASASYPAHTGSASIKATISRERTASCDLGGFLRNHRMMRVAEGEVSWQGFAFMVPNDWALPSAPYMIANFHPISGGERFRLSLTDALRLELFSRRVDEIPPADLGSIEKGVWYEVVVRTVYSRPDGRIELWMRKRGELEFVQLVDYAGASVDAESSFPYHFRFGLMLDRRTTEWNDPSADERTLYFDEIRVGDADSSFEEVAPGSNVQLPES